MVELSYRPSNSNYNRIMQSSILPLSYSRCTTTSWKRVREQRLKSTIVRAHAPPQLPVSQSKLKGCAPLRPTSIDRPPSRQRSSLTSSGRWMSVSLKWSATLVVYRTSNWTVSRSIKLSKLVEMTWLLW